MGYTYIAIKFIWFILYLFFLRARNTSSCAQNILNSSLRNITLILRKYETSRCVNFYEEIEHRTSRSRKHIFTLGAKDELFPANEITLRSEKICAQGCLRSSRIAPHPSAVFHIYFLIKICKHVTAFAIQLQKL